MRFSKLVEIFCFLPIITVSVAKNLPELKAGKIVVSKLEPELFN